jgi:ferredoxin-NADP reductase
MQRQYKIARKVNETPNTLSVFLTSEGALDRFQAGQHLAFDIPGVGERPYVLSAFSPDPKIYRITVVHTDAKDAARAASYWTDHAEKGGLIRATGPQGSFHLTAELDRPIVIFSKDIGEAAVTAMAEELAVRAAQHPVVFLHTTFNSSTFALKGKLGSLKSDLPNSVWKVWFSNPRQIDRSGKEYDLSGDMNLGACAEFFPREEFDAYICGPKEFVAATETALRASGAACRNIYRQEMGTTLAPPAEIANEKALPVLHPQSVTFTTSGIAATWTPESGTLLEFAESLGINAPFNCRTGMCGMCARKVTAGEVMKIRDTSAKTREHCQLMCSTIPMSKVEIEL